MRNRWCPYLLCLLLSLMGAGCRGEASGNVLRVWDWWSPVEGEMMRDYFRGVEKTFEADHPGADLRFQHIPFGPQYIQKVMAGMAAGRPPDCLHCSIIWANDLYERGGLMDLRPFVEQTPEMGDQAWLPAALRYGRDEGYIYGIPIEHDATCLLLNLDLLEEAGLGSDPLAMGTWEELREAALKMTKRDESGEVVQAGFMPQPGSLSGFLPWLYANGGSFFSDDRRRSTFNDAPMLESMQFLQDLQHRDKVSFPLATERQDLQLFLQGKVAIMVGGTWCGHLIEEQAPSFRFAMASIPRGPRGTSRGTMTWTNLMCIPKGARNPQLAWEFMVDYCGMRNALWKLEVLHRNSPLAGFYEAPEWVEMVKEHPALACVPEITEVGGPYPVVRFTEIDALFFPDCQGIMLGNLRPEDVLPKLQKKVDEVLEQYYAQLDESYR